MKFATLVDEVNAAIDDQREKVDRALRKLGWSTSSSFPDSVWRWKKTRTDGTTLVVDRSSAISMEVAISHGMPEA